MRVFPVEALLLLPLSVAAGVDLYLTLLVLGAASATGFRGPLPGALGDLHASGILVVLGALYAMEFTAERWSTSAVFWNALHSVIRPVAGALLALMLLDGLPPVERLPGVVVGAAAVWVVHSVRSGTRVLWWLASRRTPSAWLVALAEDVTVLGWVVLALDRPVIASLFAVLTLGAAVLLGSPAIRAFVFAVRLTWDHLWAPLTGPRWTDAAAFPRWLRRTLARTTDDEPAGRLCGVRAGAYHLPGVPRFTRGWLVMRGGVPLFVNRTWRASRLLNLRPLAPGAVTEREFHLTVELGNAGPRRARLYLSKSAPGPDRLSAELAPRAPRE